MIASHHPDFQWCLRFARAELNACDLPDLEAISQSINNWRTLAQKAREQLIAPLVYDHLSHWSDESWLSEARNALRPAVYDMTMKALAHGALQKEFIEQHLHPLGIDFAIIKGRPLAERYYLKPHTRISRDIDVWMRVEDMIPVVLSAQSAGFLVYPYGEALTEMALVFHLRHRPDISLYDSRGILIELDSRLDKSGQFFDFEDELPGCDKQTLDLLDITVLSTTSMFIYLCLHHCRHRWSKLIWLADIDAVQSASDFDLKAIESKAKAMGLWETVEATLMLHEACRQMDPASTASKDHRVQEMLKDCEAIFIDGRARELEGYQTLLTPDFPYVWQVNEASPAAEAAPNIVLAHLAKFRPTRDDYYMLPLPLGLYGLYYLLRPFLAAIRKAKKAQALRCKSRPTVHERRGDKSHTRTPPP